MIIAKIGRKIARLTQMLEDPRLFRIRQKGVSIDNFLNLNQPWLLQANINTVFDIGANVGQFAILIHEVLPTARLYSFEPLENCYEELKKRMKEVNNFNSPTDCFRYIEQAVSKHYADTVRIELF